MSLKVVAPTFSKTVSRLERLRNLSFKKTLNEFGALGVTALSAATPKDTSEASNSWSYKIEIKKNGVWALIWTNTKMAGDVPLVLLIQYGHGTKQGSYIKPINFINPALKPVVRGLKNKLRGDLIG